MTYDDHIIQQEKMEQDSIMFIFIIIGGLFLAVIIIVFGICVQKHLEDTENIKWRRK